MPERIYNHINHMIEAVKELDNISEEQMTETVEIFRQRPRVIFCGMGKPAFAINKVVFTAQSFGLDWYSMDVTHAFHGDAGIIHRGDLLVFVSKSGETEETIDVANYFWEWDKLSITSTDGSTLDRICKHNLYIPLITGEGSPFEHAPMASTTLYMIVMHGILCDIVEYTGCTIQQYAFNHPAGKIGEDLADEI